MDNQSYHSDALLIFYNFENLRPSKRILKEMEYLSEQIEMNKENKELITELYDKKYIHTNPYVFDNELSSDNVEALIGYLESNSKHSFIHIPGKKTLDVNVMLVVEGDISKKADLEKIKHYEYKKSLIPLVVLDFTRKRKIAKKNSEICQGLRIQYINLNFKDISLEYFKFVNKSSKLVFGNDNAKIISVISNKPGSGKTTVALNMAREMVNIKSSNRESSKILLVDYDIHTFSQYDYLSSFLSVDNYKNSLFNCLNILKNHYVIREYENGNMEKVVISQLTKKDIIAEIEKNILTDGDIDYIIQKSRNGNLLESSEIHEFYFFDLINSLKKYYDYIIIDHSSNLDEISTSSMQLADVVINITLEDLVSMNHFGSYEKSLLEMIDGKEKIINIINSYSGIFKNHEAMGSMNFDIPSIPKDIMLNNQKAGKKLSVVSSGFREAIIPIIGACLRGDEYIGTKKRK